MPTEGLQQQPPQKQGQLVFPLEQGPEVSPAASPVVQGQQQGGRQHLFHRGHPLPFGAARRRGPPGVENPPGVAPLFQQSPPPPGQC